MSDPIYTQQQMLKVRNENYRDGYADAIVRAIEIINHWVDAGHFEDCFQDVPDPDPDDCVCFSRKDADFMIDDLKEALIKGENK